MFRFKRFTIRQDRTAMKVGTDGVLLGAWAPGSRRILDIGTGTGVIALMMAQRFPQATVTAIELDAEAAAQARENIAQSPFADRVTAIEADIRSWQPDLEFSESLEFSEPSKPSEFFEPFSAIVANPPFYEHSLPSRSTQRDMARSAGTLSFAELMAAVRRLLAPTGTFSLVAPAHAMERLEAEAALQGLYINVRARVRTVGRKPPKRVLLTFSPTRPQELCDQTFVLQNPDGQRSDWYSALTSDFYL